MKILVLVFILIATTAALMTHASTVKMTTHRRALIIGLDGTLGSSLHYRALVQEQAPVLANLMLTGKYASCFDPKNPDASYLDHRCARAFSGHRTGKDFRWLTGPGWCSVLTGVDNNKHGVKNNSDVSLSEFATTSNAHPTIMKLLISNGLKTAASGVARFMTANKYRKLVPGIIDYECGSDGKHKPLLAPTASSSCNLTVRHPQDGDNEGRDKNLTDFLEAQVANPDIDLVMGVYDKIDSAGHWNGFSNNPKYLETITATDALVGRLIHAVENGVSQRQEEWLVIVTADHGGHAVGLWGSHGTVDLQDDEIPFIIKTFGSSKSLRNLTYPVSHLDVHPTLLNWFRLPMTAGLDGRVQGL